MLDEIRSSIRRKLSLRMRRLGLWIEKDLFQEAVAAQRALGDRLQHEIVPPSEIERDTAGAETVFGMSRQQFIARLPRALSFGYDMSCGFHSFRDGTEPASPNAAILGAVFNLGISQFDRACDNCTAARGELSRLFDEALLRRLTNQPGAHLELAGMAEAVGSPEVRMLFKTIAGFFSRLENFAQVPRNSDAWAKLSDLMVRAYSAQIRCAGARGAGADASALLKSSKAKSTLPFRILLQLIRVCENGVYGAREQATEQLVRQVATSFWLIDDLVDLVRDFRTGDVNVILLRAGTFPAKVDRESNCRDEGTFPDERFIDSTVDEACASLLAAVSTLYRARLHPVVARPFGEVILAYARRWVE